MPHGSGSITGSGGITIPKVSLSGVGDPSGTPVHIANGSGTGSINLSVPVGGVPSGALIVVGLVSSSTTAASLSDSALDTYAQDKTTGSSSSVQVFSAPCTSGLTSGQTITVNPGAGITVIADAYYITSSDTSSTRVDVSSAASGSKSPADPGAMTTTNANDCIMVFAGLTASKTISTYGTGFSALSLTSGQLVDCYRITTATGSYDGTQGWSGSATTWLAVQVAYKASTGTTYTQSLSASSASAASTTKLTSLPLSAASASAASMVRQTAMSLVASSAVQSAVSRLTGKGFSAAAASSVSMSRTTSKSLSVASGAIAGVSRVTEKTLSAPVASAASVGKSILKALSAAASSVASLARSLTQPSGQPTTISVAGRYDTTVTLAGRGDTTLSVGGRNDTALSVAGRVDPSLTLSGRNDSSISLSGVA